MAVAARDDLPMALTRHLEDLRRVLMIAGGAWLVGTTAAMVIHGFILQILLTPLQGVLERTHGITSGAIFTSPTEGLSVPLMVSACAGIVLALPVILWQLWRFIQPGLTVRERNVAGPIVLSALVLFGAGAAFAYFVMPAGLSFLATFLGGNATYLPDINSYLSFFTLIILAFGLTFELPVVVLLLGLMHIASSRALRQRRVAIYVGITLAALVVTPGADPITPIALLIPLLALFEASVLILDKVLHR